MGTVVDKEEIIAKLQREILSLQGLRMGGNSQLRLGVEPLEQAFPGHTFPLGAVHEFISYSQEEAAATNGFISGLLSKLMQQHSYCIWISVRRSIYPPALKRFGIDPHHILFVDVANHAEALWTIEESLKCNHLAAVIGEVPDLNFIESRRLQLAVENSSVTGFIHRNYPRSENTVACVSRWRIKPAVSITEEGLPGLGFPRWEIALSKIRNGRPGVWYIEWNGSAFRQVMPATAKQGNKAMDHIAAAKKFTLTQKGTMYG